MDDAREALRLTFRFGARTREITRGREQIRPGPRPWLTVESGHRARTRKSEPMCSSTRGRTNWSASVSAEDTMSRPTAG
jgi:hypothetical protein